MAKDTGEPRPGGMHFVCFARNGVWGTCVDCPRLADGEPFPEFCQHFGRYDHRLSLGDLVENYQRRER